MKNERFKRDPHGIFTGIAFSNQNPLTTGFDEAVFNQCSFKDTFFDHSVFSFCKFNECIVKNMTLYQTVHDYSVYDSCVFVDVVFAKPYFLNVIFKNCKFTRVTFRPGNLGSRGCDLNSTVFTDCVFNKVVSINTVIDDETELPKGIQLKIVDRKDLDLIRSF